MNVTVMDEMTEESSGQIETAQEDECDVPSIIVSVGEDSENVTTVKEFGRNELAPDWLEPLEEDCGDDARAGLESRRSQPAKRGRGGCRRGGRRKVISDDDWVDCPELGKGWKRKIFFTRTGSIESKKIMNYRSPKGYRVRSKKELARRLRTDLSNFVFNEGIFVDNVVTLKRRRSKATAEDKHSSFSSSKDVTLNVMNTPDNFTTTSTRLPTDSTSPPNQTELHISPARLTRMSPINQQAQHPSLDELSPHMLSHFTSPETGDPAMLAHSWLQSPLAPLSPTGTPEKDPDTHLRADSHLSPTDQQVIDSNEAVNGERQENGLSPSMKQHPHHIIFKKVGQDKWVVGKSKAENLLKKKIPPIDKGHLVKHRSMPKREKKKVKEIKFIWEQQESEDDEKPDLNDAGDDDDIDLGTKKRNRRMCGQCKACVRDRDCGKCDFCKDKPKFGGVNKKRQKCRFRQCQFHSRLQLQTWTVKYNKGADKTTDKPTTKQRRRLKTQNNRTFLDVEDDEDENEECRPSRKGHQGRRRKQRSSLKQEEDEEMGAPYIAEKELNDLNEVQYVVCDDGDTVYYETEEIYPKNSPPSIQNGTIDVVESNDHQPALEDSIPQDWVCTVEGLPDGSQVLRSIKVNGSGPLLLSDILDKDAHLQVSNVLSSDPQMSEVLNRNWLNMVQVETIVPQLFPAPEPAPEPPDLMPKITQTYSLAENDSTEDSGLLELLSSLRCTVLPAHWVGVMAKGPLLQLFQCSKLSPMADTVLQIETDFYYQINVQNQPLLPTHPVYERHPSRLHSVSLVVALLLDLEELSVCQGYQSFEAGPRQGPLLCARAALCQMLIPQDDECCEKCMSNVETRVLS